MSGQGYFIPGSHRPVTVEYIDHHLPEQHPMFANSLLQYDAVSGQYDVIPGQYGSKNQNFETEQRASSYLALGPPPGGNELPPRPDWTDTKAMISWNDLFPDAMAEFEKTKEPKGRPAEYSIRGPHSWEEIYRRLEAARVKYTENKGPIGLLRKFRRTVADNVAPLASGAVKIGAKTAPSDPIATPVLAAVELILDAVKTAAHVRREVVDAFDGLIPIFSDAELFLGTYPGDVRIRKASSDLTATTMSAIEQAIGFFLSNEFVRAGRALLEPGGYYKSMVDSLDMIKTKSSKLREEAAKSHYYEFHTYYLETRRFRRELVQVVASGFNSFNYLLKEYLVLQNRNLEKDREIKAAREENLHLHVAYERLRACTPEPQVPPSTDTYISREILRRMLDVPDLDLADLDFVDDRKGQLPETERARAEQVISTQLFQACILSTSSAKLLVHWDSNPPEAVAGVSPLSVLCATMARALRANNSGRFVSALWFCGRHVDEAVVGGRAMLASLIDQLLMQHPFDTRRMCSSGGVDLAALQAMGIDALTGLLNWLVRQLPETTTLFFIIDGVYLYEREEFSHEALPVLASLISLTGDRSVPATIKLLITSTPGTDVVRGPFEGEDLILNVDALPRLGWAPSDERMIREMGEGVDEAAWR